MERALRRTYRLLRGRDLSPAVPTAVLIQVAIRRTPDLVRGTLHGFTQGIPFRFAFRARRVVISHPQYLSMGWGVTIGRDVDIDAFSIEGVSLGDQVTIGRGATIAGSGVIANPGCGVVIGNRTSIGVHNMIWGQGGVSIGTDCLLGPNVIVVSENHVFDRKDVPIREQGEERASIRIGDDCWIGANVVVCAGVEIGEGSVVGAGSVVTHDVPAFSIAVGVPARVIGTRN